jgi:hypothetical protein
MSLSNPLMSVLCACASACSPPTWSTGEVRIIGTLCARGRRTVTAARRQMGLHEASNVGLYHQGLNRARWSVVEWSRRVVWLLGRTFVVVGGERTCGIDETWERRWGRRITRRGHDRDPLASSTPRSVATSGLRWIVLTVVITPPWTPRPWALPVLRVPAPTPAVSRRLGRRHQTVPHRARQMMLVVRRWWPGMEIPVIGDQRDRVHELGRACARWGVRWVAPRRRDAAL